MLVSIELSVERLLLHVKYILSHQYDNPFPQYDKTHEIVYQYSSYDSYTELDVDLGKNVTTAVYTVFYSGGQEGKFQTSLHECHC